AASAVVVGVEAVPVATPDAIHDASTGVARTVAAASVAIHVGRPVCDARPVSPGAVPAGTCALQAAYETRTHDRGSCRDHRKLARECLHVPSLLAARYQTASRLSANMPRRS